MFINSGKHFYLNNTIWIKNKNGFNEIKSVIKLGTRDFKDEKSKRFSFFCLPKDKVTGNERFCNGDFCGFVIYKHTHNSKKKKILDLIIGNSDSKVTEVEKNVECYSVSENVLIAAWF